MNMIDKNNCPIIVRISFVFLLPFEFEKPARNLSVKFDHQVSTWLLNAHTHTHKMEPRRHFFTNCGFPLPLEQDVLFVALDPTVVR